MFWEFVERLLVIMEQKICPTLMCWSQYRYEFCILETCQGPVCLHGIEYMGIDGKLGSLQERMTKKMSGEGYNVVM